MVFGLGKKDDKKENCKNCGRKVDHEGKRVKKDEEKTDTGDKCEFC